MGIILILLMSLWCIVSFKPFFRCPHDSQCYIDPQADLFFIQFARVISSSPGTKGRNVAIYKQVIANVRQRTGKKYSYKNLTIKLVTLEELL